MSESRGFPQIGQNAPDFHAVTTLSQDFSFSAWQEQDWVVFFSHPADFTPVSTTEVVEFARRYEDFRKKNVKLIGISVDSIHAHLAWFDNVTHKIGVTIPYPLVADSDMRISHLYGMIHPDVSTTATVRALFVIDPKRVIRAVIFYPMKVGRSVDEVLRLVTALQTADQLSCATPVNWQEGEKVVLPPPRTVQEAEKRLSQPDREVKDFYFTLKDPKA